ncbi:MAG: ATP phosphoribosyltransferase regulatory subunit [Pseudomonadota bacterium]
MSTRNRWLLPSGIEEVLPEDARIIEIYRRKLLDLYSSWGYQLVIPPFIEFLDSLLVGECEDLNLQTFKLTDQLTGRTMGVRADMTPQVARIDAHMLNSQGPTRLCYCGTVLHTRPETAGGTRSPLQIGAELYGHSGIESDIEIIKLMIATINNSGIDSVLLDLDHTGILESLIEKAGFNPDTQNDLLQMLQHKSLPDLEKLMSQTDCPDEIKTAILDLVNLHGKKEVLERARISLNAGGKKVSQCLDYLEKLSTMVASKLPEIDIHFDLAESRGYHYQHGVVFTAFCANSGKELARGGRYDNIGESFGRARPATGFSADLRQLITASTLKFESAGKLILSPAIDDPQLEETISQLRVQGDIVIHALQSEDTASELSGCTHSLQKENNKWVVKDIT